MAKFFGKVGYVLTHETSPGVWEEIEAAREYYGDVVRNARNWQNGTSINDNLVMSNEISILGDPFAFDNFAAIKWVEYGGARWHVNNVDVAYPRLTLRFGGVWNGSVQGESTCSTQNA